MGSNQMFHEGIVEAYKRTALDQIGQNPELRSVMVVFDWNGTLNDAQVPAGVWVSNGHGGKVDKPEAIIGTGWQMLKLFEIILQNAAVALKQKQDQLQEVGQALVNKGRELHNVGKQ